MTQTVPLVLKHDCRYLCLVPVTKYSGKPQEKKNCKDVILELSEKEEGGEREERVFAAFKQIINQIFLH